MKIEKKKFLFFLLCYLNQASIFIFMHTPANSIKHNIEETQTLQYDVNTV